MHVLVLGVPIAALFPLRRLAMPGWLLRVGVAGIVALATPGMSVLAQHLAEDAPPWLARSTVAGVLWTMLTAPMAAALLGRLPPLWFFREAPA